MKVTTHIYLLHIVAALALCISFDSCIEDGITTSSDDQPEFSVDTLKLGTVFTEEGTPTYSFKVYNRHDKILNISSIGFKDGGSGMFRLNVDGMSGRSFSNVEIRPNDSIFVFVEATLAANGSAPIATVEENIEFLTNGVIRQVVISAQGQDVKRLYGESVDTDSRWDADMPYRIYDSLVVAEGVTLTLTAGTRLYFHDNARLTVRGTLVSEGTAEAPVEMGGDRSGTVAADIPYEIMSKQWYGVIFTPTSRSNRLSYTLIRNTTAGVIADSLYLSPEPALQLINCRLRNSSEHALEAHHSTVTATGCEIADAGAGPLYLRGGKHIFNHCTISNYYLFSFISGPEVGLSHVDIDSDDNSGLPYLSAEFTNSIIYGMGADVSHSILDDTEVYFRHCLMRSEGTDDTHFIDMMWGVNPKFRTDRENYIFDYRPYGDSPVIDASDVSLDQTVTEFPATDYYGTPHGATPSLGAFEPQP